MIFLSFNLRFILFISMLHSTNYSFQKPGKWNAMHVRIAWEIHQNQRQSRDSDPKKMLNTNINLAPKLNLGISGGPAPTLHPPQPSSTHVKSAGGFDALPSPLNSHNSPFNFAHHNVAGFLPRIPSVATPPPHHSLQPPGGMRHSGLGSAPDQWTR